MFQRKSAFKQNNIFNILEEKGLKINNPKKFNQFLIDNGNFKIINIYLKFFQNNKERFYPNLSSDDIIDFLEIEKRIGLKILSHLLKFESKLNSIMINVLFAFYNLDYNHVLKPDLDKFLYFKSQEQYARACKSWYETAHSKLINIYKFSNDTNFINKKEDIPLMFLASTWTFDATLLFFQALNLEVQEIILKQMGFKNISLFVFYEMCDVIRKIRNTLAHNDILCLFNEIVSNEFYEYLDFYVGIQLSKKEEIKTDDQLLSLPIRINIAGICYLIDFITNSKLNFLLEVKESALDITNNKNVLAILAKMFGFPFEFFDAAVNQINNG